MLLKIKMLYLLSEDVDEKKGDEKKGDEKKVSVIRCQVSRAGCRLHLSGSGNESKARAHKSEMCAGPAGQTGGHTREKEKVSQAKPLYI